MVRGGTPIRWALPPTLDTRAGRRLPERRRVSVGDAALMIWRPGLVGMAGANSSRAPSVALLLADRGHHVTLVTELPFVCANVERKGMRVHPYRQLYQRGIPMLPNLRLRALEGRTLILEDTYASTRHTLDPVDTIVTVYPGRPASALHSALRGKVPELYVIGDAYAARTVEHAVLEGTKLGRDL
jgi:hypothetical protein